MEVEYIPTRDDDELELARERTAGAAGGAALPPPAVAAGAVGGMDEARARGLRRMAVEEGLQRDYYVLQACARAWGYAFPYARARCDDSWIRRMRPRVAICLFPHARARCGFMIRRMRPRVAMCMSPYARARCDFCLSECAPPPTTKKEKEMRAAGGTARWRRRGQRRPCGRGGCVRRAHRGGTACGRGGGAHQAPLAHRREAVRGRARRMHSRIRFVCFAFVCVRPVVWAAIRRMHFPYGPPFIRHMRTRMRGHRYESIIARIDESVPAEERGDVLIFVCGARTGRMHFPYGPPVRHMHFPIRAGAAPPR